MWRLKMSRWKIALFQRRMTANPAGELQLAPLQTDALDGTVDNSEAELVLVEEDSAGLPVNNEVPRSRCDC